MIHSEMNKKTSKTSKIRYVMCSLFIFIIVIVILSSYVWYPLMRKYNTFCNTYQKFVRISTETEDLTNNIMQLQRFIDHISRFTEEQLTEDTIGWARLEFENLYSFIKSNNEVVSHNYFGNREDVKQLNELVEKTKDVFEELFIGLNNHDLTVEDMTEANDLINDLNKQIKIIVEELNYHLNSMELDMEEDIRYTIIIFILIILIGLLLSIKSCNRAYDIQEDLNKREDILKFLSLELEDVYIFSIDKNVTYITDNVERILGVRKKDCDREFLFLLQYMDPSITRELKEHYSVNPYVLFEKETEFINEEKGKKLWIKLCIHPINLFDNHNNYIVIFYDRTENKLREDNMQKALEKLEKAVEVKQNFLSKMSHEIRTPIHSIMGLTTLAEGASNSQVNVNEYLKKINRSTKYLLSLVNNILDEEKLEHGKMLLMKDNFYFPYFISDFCEQISALAETRNLVFQYKIDNHIQDYIIGDSMRLYQILMNLCSNALKFTPQRGKVLFEVILVERINNKIKLEFIVSDNGIGMNKEFLKKLYEPFEQDIIGVSFKEGTGLGLSITKNLIELMDGEILVDSVLCRGTKFNVKLAFEVYDTYNPLDEKYRDLDSFSNLYGKHMLIVEDNEINLDILSSLLKAKGVIVDETNMGSEAIYKFINSPLGYYSIILLDIQLPDIDGFVVTETIRTSSHIDADRVIILAMSADMYSNDQEELLKRGINGYISKPIDVSTLYRKISDMVG